MVIFRHRVFTRRVVRFKFIHCARARALKVQMSRPHCVRMRLFTSANTPIDSTWILITRVRYKTFVCYLPTFGASHLRLGTSSSNEMMSGDLMRVFTHDLALHAMREMLLGHCVFSWSRRLFLSRECLCVNVTTGYLMSNYAWCAGIKCQHATRFPGKQFLWGPAARRRKVWITFICWQGRRVFEIRKFVNYNKMLLD